eukprot:51565_1
MDSIVDSDEYNTFFGISDAMQKETSKRVIAPNEKIYREAPLSKVVKLYQKHKRHLEQGGAQNNSKPSPFSKSHRTDINWLSNLFEYPRRYITSFEMAAFPYTTNINEKQCQIIMDSVHLHLDLDHFGTYENASKWIETNRNDFEYQQLAKNYKLCLQFLFTQKLKQSNSIHRNINKTYTLFI